MSMRVQSGVRPAASVDTLALPSKMARSDFRDTFHNYQTSKRCRPAQDIGTGVAGGAGVGAAGGAVVGGLVLGVPLLPVFGLGLVTGVVGAAAGGAVGGALGGVVGGVGGGITAATHSHIHAPEHSKLRKHVFSKFGVVPMRHHSSRIVRALQAGKVLSAENRTVRHTSGIHDALRDVRIFGRPLTASQIAAISNIVRLQSTMFG